MEATYFHDLHPLADAHCTEIGASSLTDSDVEASAAAFLVEEQLEAIVLAVRASIVLAKVESHEQSVLIVQSASTVRRLPATGAAPTNGPEDCRKIEVVLGGLTGRVEHLQSQALCQKHPWQPRCGEDCSRSCLPIRLSLRWQLW